jgi:glycosyltransferase involved in cell wall biosynthesis
VAISDNEAVLAHKLARSAKVRVIRDAYLGEMPDDGKRSSGQKATTVCGAGRLIFARNPEAFVRMARRLTDSRGDIRCLWIGGGDLDPIVGKMVRDMNLTSKVDVTGWLPHTEAVNRLKKADIFVHFSRWDGLPNAVLEAMAWQLPVVASDIPGNRDLIEHGVNGFLAKNENELAEYTLKLIDQPELRAEFGKKGRDLVAQSYSVGQMLRGLESLYEENSAKSTAFESRPQQSAGCSS